MRLALAATLLALPAAPAYAGDDADCDSSWVGDWNVFYDSLCLQQIMSVFYANDHGIGVEFTFGDGPSTGPTRFIIFEATMDVIQEPATEMAIAVDGRVVERAAGVFDHDFSPGATREVFAALRNRRNVVLTVLFDSGPQDFTLVSSDFETAFQQLQ